MGFIRPASGVTMPWRSASASLPVAIWYSSLRWISDAIALGDEQSIRIFPSQSRVMKRHVGSTSGFTTVRSSRWRSAISPQYATLAPPSGSAPIRTPASRITSMSTTDGRSSTYVPMKSYGVQDVRARPNAIRWTPSRLARISSLARPAITLVASVSAGPPCGGLYLKPPSYGGLWLGVTTIPSASPPPVVRPELARRIACETPGVGV